MRVGEDLDEFARQILGRFEGTSAYEIGDLQEKLAGFDLDLCDEVLRDLRLNTPGHFRIVDSQKLQENARRLHVARGVEIKGEKKNKTQFGLFVPLELGKKIDRRKPDEISEADRRERIKSWVDGLEKTERDRLLDEAVLEWEGELRSFYRQRGVDSFLVRDAMVRASHRLNPQEAA